VLTEKAAKVFRFEEQNQLHEEIIDTGLAQIYQSHLEVAERMAKDEGVDVVKTLLDGKAFQKVLDHARKTTPGSSSSDASECTPPRRRRASARTREPAARLPVRHPPDDAPGGPQLDVRAEESIRWTPRRKSGCNE